MQLGRRFKVTSFISNRRFRGWVSSRQSVLTTNTIVSGILLAFLCTRTPMHRHLPSSSQSSCQTIIQSKLLGEYLLVSEVFGHFAKCSQLFVFSGHRPACCSETLLLLAHFAAFQDPSCPPTASGQSSSSNSPQTVVPAENLCD